MSNRKAVSLLAMLSFLWTQVFIYGQSKVKPILIVMPLQVLDGLTKTETIQITQYIEYNILQMNEYDLVERTIVEKLVKDMERRVEGPCDADCAMRVAKQASAQKIIMGTAGKFGKAFSIQIKLIDVETNRMEKGSFILKECPLEELPTYLSALVQDLFGPSGTGQAQDKTLKRDPSKQTPPVVKTKAAPEQKNRKKGKFPWLLVGGLVVAGGIVAAILISGKKPDPDPDPEPGLVAYYPFTGSAADASGRGNHGTVFGGPFYTADRFGNAHGAIQLDGVDDYVELPNESNFDLTTFTVVAVIKIPDYSQTNYILSKGPDFGNYSLHISSASEAWTGYAGYCHRTSGGNWSSNASLSPIPLDTYAHIAVTVDSSAFKSYLNGALQYQSSSPTMPLLNNEKAAIGLAEFASAGSFFFKGIVDEIRFYDRVLTEVEIQALYSGSGLHLTRRK